jgi:dihydrofolate reductase
MSLDGFVAAPRQSVQNPFGIGGMRLNDWVFPLAAFRTLLGIPGEGVMNESNALLEESLENLGATVMGRNMFGGYPGKWSATDPWNGWWGANPPFHHPVFVITHYPREPLVLEGGTTFTFVTDGIASAFAQARAAAGTKDISLGGGAQVAREFLKAGLVDEMTINLVPILLGNGERLFDGTGDDLHGLELVRTIAMPTVTHLRFSRGG